VPKALRDGVFEGKVVGHVPDLDNDEMVDGEMFVIQYESGNKQETVGSQELMGMLVGAQEEEEREEEESKEEDMDNLQETKEEEEPKPKPKKKVADPLIGRKVKTWMDIDDDGEVQVKGTIISKSQKKSGKKKGTHYEIEYDDSKLSVEIPNEKVHSSDIKGMLV
jgi:hypothetical protein